MILTNFRVEAPKNPPSIISFVTVFFKLELHAENPIMLYPHSLLMMDDFAQHLLLIFSFTKSYGILLKLKQNIFSLCKTTCFSWAPGDNKNIRRGHPLWNGGPFVILLPSCDWSVNSRRPFTLLEIRSPRWSELVPWQAMRVESERCQHQ